MILIKKNVARVTRISFLPLLGFLILITGVMLSINRQEVIWPSRSLTENTSPSSDLASEQDVTHAVTSQVKTSSRPPLQATAHFQADLDGRQSSVHSYTLARGRIRHAFSLAAQRLGVPYTVVTQFVQAMASQVNFKKKIWPGDRFWLIYHHPATPGSSDNRLVAAKFCHLDLCHTAYWYRVSRAVKGYFSARGKSLKRSFLRTPIADARISSPFSLSRFDPVLKKWLPHDGVDFAAPVGTPIHATANGWVKFIGWLRGYG
ncbi:MAG: peptidoglycan DD-metalloendopeptidase family protein, partial [Pseudomonadota bacterium]|nr:peptidoglycan DD-metalloendopeptidase family protein [Pseudomonadota bacterium]